MKISFAQNNTVNTSAPCGFVKTPEYTNEKYYETDYILEGVGAKLPNPKRALYELSTYPKKGLKGSVNSNFYEFLKMGNIPYIVGSAAMIALCCVGKGKYNTSDRLAASKLAKQFATGVVLYGLGKKVGGDSIKKGVHLTTGIDVDLPYRKIVAQAPETKGKALESVDEYHKVFESVDFINWPILEKLGTKHGDRYEFYKHVAKKAGYKEDLNAPSQTMQPKIKNVVTRTYATKNVASYLWAAAGVALSRQQAIVDFAKNDSLLKLIKQPKKLAKKIGTAALDSVKQMWKGTNKVSGIMGKVLLIGTLLSVPLSIAYSKKGFKAEPHKSIIDNKKPVEEC